MLNCKEASALMSQGMDDRLPFGKRLSLRLHLMMCHGCSNFNLQIHFLRQAAQRLRSQDSTHISRLSDEAKQRITKALHELRMEEHPPHNNGGKST